MARLEFRFLGDFEVRRDGRPQPLPPSRKTRALLAYLSLQPRRFRREHLCELLWEIPDDPRGSLRWSLSKLRRLVDEPDRPRIIADRDGVAVDAEGISIDVRDLRGLLERGLAQASVDELEAAAARYHGHFLEGLEFPDFHDFHSWCVAQGQQALRDRIALREELLRRFADDPERALPHARALVGLSPYDEDCRARLIRLLHEARQHGEAEEHYQLGLRMLREAGVPSSGALAAARGGHTGRGPMRGPPVSSAAEPPAAARADPAAGALLGREQETALIADTLAGVTRMGRAGLLLVRGPPGIGKSRVLEAAQALARRHTDFALQAAAFEADAVRPFALWTDALRARDATLPDSVFGATGADRRDRLFAALGELLAGESARQPVVLIFDDAHWCDESSAAALHYVVRLNRDRPLLAVVAVRDGDLRDNVPLQQALRGLRRDGLLRELALQPLSEEVLARLIREQAPACDGVRLSRQCGGNPLLAIELAHAEAGDASGGSLDELIGERLERLPATGVEVLHWAAVLSPRLDVGTLVRMAGLDAETVGAALEQAERHGMIRSTGHGLRFAHDLIARAIYRGISPLRRQVMHRRVAQMLEAETARDLALASDLAHHALQSQDPALGARASVSAGRLCLRFFANDDARSLARKGLQLAEALPEAERVRVELELHDVLLAAAPVADWEASAERYVALAERALDHGAMTHARLGYHMASYLRWEHGHWKGAREQTLQAGRVVRGGEDEPHIVGMAETARCLAMLERDLSSADAMLMEARALAQRRHFNHQAICCGLGMLRFHENRLDEAEELFQESRTLCKAAGERLDEFLANEYLVMLDLQRGRVEQARERCLELVGLAEKLREGSERPFARALLALCDCSLHDDCSALDAALEELRMADAKHRLACILTRAAWLDCKRGRTARAMERAREALGYARLLERATEMLLASAVLCHGHTLRGEAAAAAELAEEAARLARAGAAAWAGDMAAALLGASVPPLQEDIA